MQSRAVATRERIIDVAVELFYERGYADVGLADITARADLTTGAFYYHFRSKEELGAAIIKRAWPLWWAIVEQYTGQTPRLENLITMSFELSALLKRNRLAFVAQNLNLAFYQHHEDVRGFEATGTNSSLEMLSAMISENDLREGVTPDDVANQVSMNIFGCHILSTRFNDSALERLARSWLILLRGTVPPESLPYFEQFVARTADLCQ